MTLAIGTNHPTALYYYQHNADYEEQVECLHLFGHKSVTLETDPHERAELFEKVIQEALTRLDDSLYGV